MRHDSEGISFLLGIVALALGGFAAGVAVSGLMVSPSARDVIVVGVYFAGAVALMGMGLYKIIHAALLAFLPYRDQEVVREKAMSDTSEAVQ